MNDNFSFRKKGLKTKEDRDEFRIWLEENYDIRSNIWHDTDCDMYDLLYSMIKYFRRHDITITRMDAYTLYTVPFVSGITLDCSTIRLDSHYIPRPRLYIEYSKDKKIGRATYPLENFKSTEELLEVIIARVGKLYKIN